MTFQKETEVRRYIERILETAFKEDEIGPRLVETANPSRRGKIFVESLTHAGRRHLLV